MRAMILGARGGSMVIEQVGLHFQVGNKVRLEFVAEVEADGIREVDAIITAVQGEVVVVELPSVEMAAAMGGYGALEVVLGSFGGDMYCRCVANFPGDVREKRVLLYVERVLETVPQRRDDPRVDLELPLYVRALHTVGPDLLRAHWEALLERRRLCRAPLLRSCAEGRYVDAWEGAERVWSQPVNLSASGLLFYGGRPLQPGSHFHADIFLPTSPARVIAVIARVIRSRRVNAELMARQLLASAQRGAGSEALYANAAVFELISDADHRQLKAYTLQALLG